MFYVFLSLVFAIIADKKRLYSKKQKGDKFKYGFKIYK